MAFNISCLTLGFFTKFQKEQPEVVFFQRTDYVAKKNGNQWFRPIGLTTFKEILHAREALYLSILTIS